MQNHDITRIPVAPLADGSELAIHVHDIRGTADGPTVGICAAIHGNEPTGTFAIRELVRALEGVNLGGRLLLLPVANPPAFAVNARHSPLDDHNLNRLFPGDPSGWISQRLAHTITEDFLMRVDVLIDLHSGGAQPTVDYVYIRNAEELSRSFGSRVLYQAEAGKTGTVFHGTSSSVVEDRDIPSVTIELGGGIIDQRPYVQRCVRGLLNMLRTLDVLGGDPTPPPGQITVSRIETFRPRAGGFLDTMAPPLGETVAAGDPLGRIVNPHTFVVVEEIVNSVDNGVMILSHLTPNLVQPGDYGYMVGGTD